MAEPLLHSRKKEISKNERQTYFTFGQEIKPGKFHLQLASFSDL